MLKRTECQTNRDKATVCLHLTCVHSQIYQAWFDIEQEPKHWIGLLE